MKILAVALALLLVQGFQGAAIPESESMKNESIVWQQPFWDLNNIGMEVFNIAMKNLHRTGLLNSAQEMLATAGEELYEELGNETYTIIHNVLVAVHENIKQYYKRFETELI